MNRCLVHKRNSASPYYTEFYLRWTSPAGHSCDGAVFIHLRGIVLCALCNIGDADRWASGFHICLQKNEHCYFCRKGNALQIPGFGNGSIHSGIVRNGADLACLDNPQTEKQSLIEQMRAME